jgi:hypothetical protein
LTPGATAVSAMRGGKAYSVIGYGKTRLTQLVVSTQRVECVE